MSDHRTRSGARLRNESFMYRRGNYVAITADDLVQPRCKHCGKLVNDDRALSDKFRGFCSTTCGTNWNAIRRGEATGRGCEGRWRFAYDKAREARGAWISLPCESKTQAERLQKNINGKNGFEASRDGLTVSIRVTVAA